MSMLPDEIWRRVLEIGFEISGLTFRDLCCLAISSRRLNRLSSENSLWSRLLAVDFPPDISSTTSDLHNPSSKSTYRSRFERDRARKLTAHRRAVLNVESDIAIRSKNLKDLQLQLRKEEGKMRTTMAELANMERVRQASAALNVWQPQVVRGWQKQIVEQSAVPVEYRVKALEMELKVCRNQIAVATKAYKEQKQKLEASKERLASLKYHPLDKYKLERETTDTRKHKKLKKSKPSVMEKSFEIEEGEDLGSPKNACLDYGSCSNI
ncbi:F-box protein SKIP24 isoform X2 [Aristolochia californica]|uniref:F-box protein SKIP24 isoform X2 n=1 Tax=Aristolochia californica TaxID=171875 RepID=UPI0035D9AE31